MDFVDWATHVLDGLLREEQASPRTRLSGLMLPQIMSLLLSDGAIDAPTSPAPGGAEARTQAVWQALEGLEGVGLIRMKDTRRSRTSPWITTNLGREGQSALLPVWHHICAQRLAAESEALLRLVNRLSPREEEDCTWLESLDGERVLAELRWPDFEQLLAAAIDLEDIGFARLRQYLGRNLKIQASYQGLVWETRRAFTIDALEIDRLVSEWETTSVDFKRELYTDTKDQKAELAKDLIGLANTQASGRRWMIIGFDDKTRAYHGSPGKKITQNHLEQIIAPYIEPNLQIRYKAVNYKGQGQVGKLEVLRDPRQLPYLVAKDLAGQNKRISAGQVFVRHGTQTEEPTPAELQSLREEGERARTFTQVT